MAVARRAPKCSECGEAYKGKYRDQSNLPLQLRIVGDTFIGWDIEGHVCSKKKDPPLSKKDIRWHQSNQKIVEEQAAKAATESAELRSLFVPWPLAIRLKNLGFSEPCFAYYWTEKDTFHYSAFYKRHNELASRAAAPLWQQVIKWLDDYKVYIDIDHEFGEDWTFCVDNGGTGHSGDETIYKTRTEALTHAINKALDVIRSGVSKINYRGEEN